MYTVTHNRQLAASVKRPADGAASAVGGGAALHPSKRAAAAPDPPAACTCSAHAHKQVDVLCLTCHRAVCSLCLVSTCKAHQTEAIEGIAVRCVQGRLAACDSAKQRFRTAVADAAKTAKAKMSAAIDGNAARLLKQGDVLWAAQCADVAASSGALQERVDAAFAAGSAGIAGGCGAEMLLHWLPCIRLDLLRQFTFCKAFSLALFYSCNLDPVVLAFCFFLRPPVSLSM